MTYFIAQPCIGVQDGACVEVCPVDCIHTSPEEEQYFIHPEECVHCGACQHACPVQAIYFEGEEPEEYRHFVEINAAFFR